MSQERNQSLPENGETPEATVSVLASAPEAFGDELQGMVEYLDREVKKAERVEVYHIGVANEATQTRVRVENLHRKAKELRDAIKCGGRVEELPL